MGTSPTSLAPPPTADGQDVSSPSQPQGASPSPPQDGSASNSTTQDAILVVNKLRGIAKAYPAAAPIIAEMNNQMRKVMAVMMSQQNPGEPQAPPSGG